MIRKRKALSLTIMALLAFGAIAAQGASASNLTVPKGLAVVYVTGSGEASSHSFTSSGNVVCGKSSYSGKATPSGETVSEITLTPVYSECVAFGFATTHVKVNGCTYTLTTPTSVKAGEVTWDPSNIHVLCPAGKKIEITPTTFGVSVCTQSIGEQTPTGGHIIGTNTGTESEMRIADNVTVKGVTYTGTGGACGTSGNNAEYGGKTVTRCYKNELHTELINCTFS